ncbi:MAG: hypothetical protein ACFB5Z_04225 [Elainellaceae cyanobacterium]
MSQTWRDAASALLLSNVKAVAADDIADGQRQGSLLHRRDRGHQLR